MPVDYFDFRTRPWHDRITLFNTISAEERAQLVRTHVAWWLEAHREELSPEQIIVLEEAIAAIVPELYTVSPDVDVTAPPMGRLGDKKAIARVDQLMDRAKSVFTLDQMRQALTMHWKPGDFGVP